MGDDKNVNAFTMGSSNYIWNGLANDFIKDNDDVKTDKLQTKRSKGAKDSNLTMRTSKKNITKCDASKVIHNGKITKKYSDSQRCVQEESHGENENIFTDESNSDNELVNLTESNKSFDNRRNDRKTLTSSEDDVFDRATLSSRDKDGQSVKSELFINNKKRAKRQNDVLGSSFERGNTSKQCNDVKGSDDRDAKRDHEDLVREEERSALPCEKRARSDDQRYTFSSSSVSAPVLTSQFVNKSSSSIGDAVDVQSDHMRVIWAKTSAMWEKKRDRGNDRGAMNDPFRNKNRQDLCADINTAMLRTTWTLLSRLSLDKCLTALGVRTETHRRVLTNIVQRIQWTLVRLDEFGTRHGINLNIFEKSFRDLCAQLDPTEEASVNALVDIEQDSIPDDVASDSRAVKIRLFNLIAQLDSYVQALIMCAAIRRGCSFANSLNGTDVAFTCLNLIHDEEHGKYLQNCIQYQFYAQQNKQYKISGYYLISLEQRNVNLKFPAFVDRSGYLATIARQFVSNVIFAETPLPQDVKVFLNLAMRRNCTDFNILNTPQTGEIESFSCSSDTILTSPTTASSKNCNKIEAHHDPHGVLALVDMAYLKYDEIKNFIIVKGYIVSTFASIS